MKNQIIQYFKEKSAKIKIPFIALRASVYLAGLVVVAWIIFLNVQKEKRQTFNAKQSLNSSEIVFSVPAKGNYTQAKLTVKTKDDGIDSLEPQLVRTFSPLVKGAAIETNQATIDSEDRLKEILFEDNSSRYPNGSLLSYGQTVYLVEKGKLRGIKTASTFNRFGFDWSKVKPLPKDDFSSFELGNKIGKNELVNFPRGIILKTDTQYAISDGAGATIPIVSVDIAKVWTDFSFILTNSPAQQNPAKFTCNQSSANNATCTLAISDKENLDGNVFYVKIPGLAPQNADQITVELTRKYSVLETLGVIKSMLW